MSAGEHQKEGVESPCVAHASSHQYIADVYRTYRAVVYRYVVRRFGMGPPDPEDVTQAAFARYAALPDHSVVRNIPAFLTQTARNLVLDEHRRDGRRAELIDAMSALPPQSQFGADRLIEGQHRLDAISKSILAMEEKRRTVLIMHSIHELGAAEIARRMGLSRTRVVQLLADAIAICTRAAREFDGGEE